MSVAQSVYLKLPPALQAVLINIYAASRYRKRYGRDFEDLVRAIRYERSLDGHAADARQAERLGSMLTHAEASVPYYRDRLKSGRATAGNDPLGLLAQLPVLSKDEVRRWSAAIKSDAASPYWTTETSGSTGTPLTVATDRFAYRLSMALVAAHERNHGVDLRDRRATFAGRLVQPVDLMRPPYWRYNRVEKQMLFSAYHMTDQTLPLYADALEQFAPVEIIGYPSAISTLAEHLLRTKRRLTLPLRAVITNSESLLSWQRDLIVAALNAPVFDYYGSAESVSFAGQCAAGRYHPDRLIGYAEILDEHDRPVRPGESGRLIASTTSNFAMPLLRYDTGDIVEMAEGPCDCGESGTTWNGVLGRIDDVVVTPSGTRVGRLDHIFKGVEGVRECQVAQIAPDTVELRVVPDGRLSAETRTRLLSNTAARLGFSMQILITEHARIPRTSRGKFRSVVKEF